MRVFEVPRAGRAVGHGARVPAARPLHGRAARAGRRRRRRRLRRRPADVRVRHRRQHAGPHRGQRALRPEPAARSTPTPSSGRSTSCRRRGPTACAPRSSPTSARSGHATCSSASAPAPRRHTSPPSRPERAIGDLRRIADLVAGDADLATSLGHDVDAPAGEWRFRVYRRGAPAALSELLPLLDHLGVAGPRRAAVHVPPRRRAGLPLRHRRPGRRPTSTSTSSGGRRCRRRSASSSPARRGRRFNRLVLRAGLSAREVDDRAVLRQVPAPDRVRLQPALHRGHARHPPALVADLVALFHARFDPAGGAVPPTTRGRPRPAAVVERITDALDAIPSLDDDRICRAFLTLIDATVRTNYYRGRPAIAVKLDPGGDPRPAAAAAEARDLGVRAAGRGRPPPRRRRSPAAGCAGAIAGRTSAPRCSG